jgi:hypothetical protein
LSNARGDVGGRWNPAAGFAAAALGAGGVIPAFGGGGAVIGLGTDESNIGALVAMVDSTSSPSSEGGRSLSS